LQESALQTAKLETEEALRLVRIARQKLKEQRTLTPDELTHLVKTTTKSEFKWSDKMEALANKHFSPEQLQLLRARRFDEDDRERVSKDWQAVFADILALGPDPDPACEAALMIARRASALLQEFSRGDPKLLQAAAKMNMEAFNDPELAPRMPAPVSHFQFLQRAIAELQRRGEPVFCMASPN
jgi:hypothetical protein